MISIAYSIHSCAMCKNEKLKLKKVNISKFQWINVCPCHLTEHDNWNELNSQITQLQFQNYYSNLVLISSYAWIIMEIVIYLTVNNWFRVGLFCFSWFGIQFLRCQKNTVRKMRAWHKHIRQMLHANYLELSILSSARAIPLQDSWTMNSNNSFFLFKKRNANLI